MHHGTVDRSAVAVSAILLLAGLASAAVAPEGSGALGGSEPVGPAAASGRKGVLGMVAEGVAVANTAGLPNFDARDDRHVAVKRGPLAAAFQDDVARLSATVQGLVVDDDQYFGTPRFVRSTQAMVTAAANASARDVLYRFALQYPGLLGCDAAEMTGNRYDRDFITEHNGVHHLTVIQQIDGIDIVHANARANVTARGELINLSSTLLRRPEGGFVTVPGTITDADAVRLAAAACNITLAGDPETAQTPQGPALKRTWNTPAELRANDALETSFTYFALDASTVRPAWNVLIAAKGIGHTYEVIIDAVDGSLLSRHNRLEFFGQTQPMTFRVHTAANPNPGPATATPSGLQYPAASRSLVTIDPANLLAVSPLGWIVDGGTTTLGNNVSAYPDINSSNTADEPRPDGGAARVFDFAMDTSLAPSAYTMASTTQLFYLANLYHDRLYSLGFTEAASNFQTNNLGRGGRGNDAILGEAQDGSGTDNANFSTSGTDGSTGRCQMYVFTGPNPDRDGSFDSDVVYHELTHGMSIRLHRGLSAVQSRGMGEGWSDFFAIGLNAAATDLPGNNVAAGPYASFQLGGNTNNNYWGIRRYPYSTNLNINPLTFKSIDPNQISLPPGVPRSSLGSATASEVHNVGEVWCNMLHECRAALITANGFAGNETALRLVVDSMKLSPTDPTFVQSRDAIIQADLVSTGGANAGRLWTAFAKRGIGASAVAPVSSTTTGVVESYTEPTYVIYSFPDGIPAQVQPNTATTVRVNVTPTGLTVTPNSGRLTYIVGAAAPVTVAMTEVAAGQYTANLPAATCFAKLSYYFTVGTSAGDRTSPADPALAKYQSTVFISSASLFSDDFETNRSWTVGPNTATTGLWIRGVPVATAAQPGSGRTGTGSSCFFTGQGVVGGTLGAADVDGGLTTLVSPTIDLTGFADATVSYYRWYSNGTSAAPYADLFTVDVSVNNGATWTRAETIGPGSVSNPDTNPGWRAASWTFSSLGLVATNQVKLRFIADDAGAGSVVEAAIDDVLIFGLLCTPPAASCSITDVAPPGGDGTVDGNDFVVFINSFTTGDVAVDPAADVAGGGPDGSQPDGIIDGSDFVAFINAFAAGC